MLKVSRSCKDIFNASPSSGYYNITINNGSIVNYIIYNAFEINNRLIIISLIISTLMSVFIAMLCINGSIVQVYCDMEGTRCGAEGGRTRVAFVNMSEPGATCP